MMSVSSLIFLKLWLDELMGCVYFELCFATGSLALPSEENKLPAHPLVTSGLNTKTAATKLDLRCVSRQYQGLNFQGCS